MIVEDEPTLRSLYTEMLPIFGINILGSAKDGDEAVSMFKTLAKKPDFIIMDHRMPLKDGIEATREILQVDSASKIIFASADQGVKNQALAIGAIYFLHKPFLLKNLVAFIKENNSSGT